MMGRLQTDGLQMEFARFSISGPVEILPSRLNDVRDYFTETFREDLLTAQRGNQLWVLPGFAHGSCELARDSTVAHKVTAYYSDEHDRGLAWDDPERAIIWPPLADSDTLLPKDHIQPCLADLMAVQAHPELERA